MQALLGGASSPLANQIPSLARIDCQMVQLRVSPRVIAVLPLMRPDHPLEMRRALRSPSRSVPFRKYRTAQVLLAFDEPAQAPAGTGRPR